MKPFLATAEITLPNSPPFAVIAIDPSVRVGGGCRGIVQSLHWSRDEADAAIALAEQVPA